LSFSSKKKIETFQTLEKKIIEKIHTSCRRKITSKGRNERVHLVKIKTFIKERNHRKMHTFCGRTLVEEEKL